VEKMRKYDLVALPVVDSQGIMLGIVTHDDVFDVAEEETTEDILKGASIAPLQQSYKSASIGLLYRKRVPWLILLIFVALGSTAIIVTFEETLEATVILAAFLPLLVAMAGNTGSQSATLMVRGLATGDLQLSDWFRSLGKELAVGIPLGITLGILAAALGYFVAGRMEIGYVVGATMVTIILVANLVGMTLPFILARLKMDPAVASAPLVTTLLDAIGILIYFTWAHLILGV
jgi:magnesium transporter